MKHIPIDINGRTIDGYEILAGPFSIVFVTTGTGMVVCGAFDLAALDRLNVAAAKVTGVSSVDQLLAGTVKDVNQAAKARGIEVGVTGREALAKMTG